MANSGTIDEELLKKHSFDLVHFPMYLDQRAAPRVRVDIATDGEHADLMGLFVDDKGDKIWRFARIVADDSGCVTKSDAFFHTVHAAFGACAEDPTYIGFTRAGPPVYAPLFVLSMLYRKYGRGLYLAGQILPTPWPELTVGYEFTIR